MNVKFTETEITILQWLKNNSPRIEARKVAIDDYFKEVTKTDDCDHNSVAFQDFLLTNRNFATEGYITFYKKSYQYGPYRYLGEWVLNITEKGLATLRELDA